MRCYNGQPDSKLQAFLDEQTRLRAAIQARGYSVTYFPNGEFWQAFDDARHLPATSECSTLAAVERALRGEKV